MTSITDILRVSLTSPFRAKGSHCPILRFGGCAIVSLPIRLWVLRFSLDVPQEGGPILHFRSALLFAPMFQQ